MGVLRPSPEMKVWLQRSDFSSEDLPDPSIEFASEALASFGWQAEIDKEATAAQKGEECCPAGMGFIHKDGPILHVIPRESGKYDVCYMFSERKKILFFNVSRSLAPYVHDVSRATVQAMIEAHYAGQHDEVGRLVGAESNENDAVP